MSLERQDFIQKFDKFKEALDYIKKNSEALEKDPARLEKIKKNFIEKFEKPLDEAWHKLDKKEQKKLATIYFVHRKNACPEVEKVREVADLFHGKIVQVTLND